MARKRKEQKDPVSLVISVVVHVALIGGVGYWAAKTGKLDEITRRILQAVRADKKDDQKPEPPKTAQTKAPPAKLPPINTGLPPSGGGGSRRAVASDAPDAVGESFFADTRTQTKGPSSGTAGSGDKPKAVKAPPPPPPPRIVPRAFSFTPPKTDIKQLLVERAKATALVESFGAEQISKSGASDVSDIVGRISGASLADGKFAVVRGLADRYTLTTLNGADIPSADPNRRGCRTPVGWHGPTDHPKRRFLVKCPSGRRLHLALVHWIGRHIAGRPIGLEAVAGEGSDVGGVGRLDAERARLGRREGQRDVVLLGAEHGFRGVRDLDGEAAG